MLIIPLIVFFFTTEVQVAKSIGTTLFPMRAFFPFTSEDIVRGAPECATNFFLDFGIGDK